MIKRLNKSVLYTVSILVIALVIVGVRLKAAAASTHAISSEAVSLKAIDTQIMAAGMVRSQNEATLHFLTGGKVAYLPLKEGDKVYQGQTIASLDTFTIQQQLNAALNSYRIAKTSYDQTVDNANDKYLKAQLTTPYNLYDVANLNRGDATDALNNAIERLVNISEATKDNAQIQVEIAKYAFTLASINSPFTGQLIHEDISTPNVVVTTTTAFSVMDPTVLIFKANISEDDINYVSEGATATIKLNGATENSIEGTVIKIYPDKITLPTGENVYQVDIASTQLNQIAKYKQEGVVLITNKYSKPVILAPTWLLLGGNNIWILQDNQPVLKQVTTGEVNGEYTEITGGLNADTKIIKDPRSIISPKYLVL